MTALKLSPVVLLAVGAAWLVLNLPRSRSVRRTGGEWARRGAAQGAARSVARELRRK